MALLLFFLTTPFPCLQPPLYGIILFATLPLSRISRYISYTPYIIARPLLYVPVCAQTLIVRSRPHRWPSSRLNSRSDCRFIVRPGRPSALRCCYLRARSLAARDLRQRRDLGRGSSSVLKKGGR
ncbi:hypothetical protein BDW75DRAFT_98496 [Aspergillus navahoensis]